MPKRLVILGAAQFCPTYWNELRATEDGSPQAHSACNRSRTRAAIVAPLYRATTCSRASAPLIMASCRSLKIHARDIRSVEVPPYIRNTNMKPACFDVKLRFRESSDGRSGGPLECHLRRDWRVAVNAEWPAPGTAH